MNTQNFQLARNPFGHLTLTAADGTVHENVVPVRAFPISAPDLGFSLVADDGHEIVWIDSLADLAADTRALIEEELANREFVPRIERLYDVSSFSTPSTWRVRTDRGDTAFVLKGEEDIRRLGGAALLITDGNGILFLIRDLTALDKNSRRLLDRFL